MMMTVTVMIEISLNTDVAMLSNGGPLTEILSSFLWTKNSGALSEEAYLARWSACKILLHLHSHLCCTFSIPKSILLNNDIGYT